MSFQVTKLITDGTLKGMEIVEVLPYRLEVGKVVKKCSWTGPGYKVIACVQIS